jgi:hypothetical protein
VVSLVKDDEQMEGNTERDCELIQMERLLEHDLNHFLANQLCLARLLELLKVATEEGVH